MLHWTVPGSPNIVVAFSTRQGGHSILPGGGLNLGLHVGDVPQLVLRNRASFLSALGLSLEDLVLGEQVHGSQVAVMGAQDAGRGAWKAREAIPGVDALVTQTPGIILGGCFADCVPDFLVDPDHAVVALVHAGWRGTAREVTREAWQTLQRVFASQPQRALAFIGPAVGRCCYTVDQRVAGVMQGRWWWHQVSQPSGPYWHLDLGLANQMQLEAEGIRTENCHMCTCCQRHFFSHRRDRGRTGRMLGLVSIRRGQGMDASCENMRAR